MTVCVAALAEDGKAIVLVADKAITHGDNRYRPALEGESGSIEKILRIGESSWYALLAGNPTNAERIVQNIGTALSKDASLSATFPTMIDLAKSAYQQVREASIVDSILKPRLLSKDTFINRSVTTLPLDDYYFRDVADRVGRYDLGTSLIVCGFDKEGEGKLFTVREPGIVDSHEIVGFAAIGVGEEAALGVLVRRGAEPEDSLEMALYQAFEAKAYAERIQGRPFTICRRPW